MRLTVFLKLKKNLWYKLFYSSYNDLQFWADAVLRLYTFSSRGKPVYNGIELSFVFAFVAKPKTASDPKTGRSKFGVSMKRRILP